MSGSVDSMGGSVKGNPLLFRLIVETLPRFTYRFANEIELHKLLAQVLADAGVEFKREVVAGPKDRFDFLVPGGIVIEAKVQGSMPEALRQCGRYAARADVSAVALVATRQWARGSSEYTSHGKPVRVVKISGAAF